MDTCMLIHMYVLVTVDLLFKIFTYGGRWRSSTCLAKTLHVHMLYGSTPLETNLAPALVDFEQY
jgi:hypothetical protein